MRLRSFIVRSYGLLRDLGRIELGDFALFWGKNEQGKTMLLEALLNLLLGRGALPGGVGRRVPDDVDGDVWIEFQGKEHKVRKRGWSKLVGIPSDVLYNLFVVHASSLRVDSEVYGDVGERITGTSLSGIKKLKEHMFSVVGLSPSGKALSDSKSAGHLKSRYESAVRLIKQIRDRKDVASIGELEASLRRLQEELDTLREKIKQMEQAGMWARYIELRSKLDKLDALKDRLSGMGVDREPLKRWKELSEELGRAEDREKALIEEFEMLGRRAEELRRQKEALQEELTEWGNKEREVERLEGWLRDWKQLRMWAYRGLILGMISGGVGLLLGVFVNLWFLLVLAFVFVGVLWLHLLVRGSYSKVCSLASALGFKSTGEALLSEMALWKGSFEQLKLKMSEIGGEEKALVNRRAKVVEELEDLRKTIVDIRGEIAEVSVKCGVDSIEDYERLVAEKEGLVIQCKTIEQELIDVLGEDFREEISRMAGEVEETTVEFDRRELEKLRIRERELEEEVARLREREEDVVRFLGEIEKGVNTVLEGEWYVRGTDGLSGVLSALEDFIRGVDRRVELARVIAEVLDEIAEEEAGRLDSIMGEGSELSRWFSSLTGGLYDAVLFDGEIKVKRKEGTVLLPSQLSSGALDQLYFLVRVFLGEKLLEGEKGFFLLDDPFLRADGDRLRYLTDFLFDLVDRGWQVIYFSAKDEVRRLLEGKIPIYEICNFSIKGD